MQDDDRADRNCDAPDSRPDGEPAPLTSRQRKYLRGLAHDLQPIVQVGQAGVTDAVVAQLDRAFLNHELIKVRMREPDDKRGMAQALAEGSGAALCGLVGHTAILYRRHPEEPLIELPQ